ncbi:MAG: ABC transporter permease [Desulfomonile sp.]|nr:ABC transporter permease [Desulfomonile sp.]
MQQTESQYKRPKETRRSVLIADKVADKTITIGGALVIAAVLGMMVFLVLKVVPLFEGGAVQSHREYSLEMPGSRTLALAIDDLKTIAVRVSEDGRITAWHVDSGSPLESPRFDLQGKQVTAFSQCIDQRHMAFGFFDGSVRFASVQFKTEILTPEGLPAGLKELSAGDKSDGRAIYSIIPGNQVRKTWIEVELEEPIQASASNSPIIALDYRLKHFGERPSKTLAAIDRQLVGVAMRVESKLNLFTRKTTLAVDKAELPALPAGTAVTHALVDEGANSVYFVDKSGTVYRFNTRGLEEPFLAEVLRVTPSGVDVNVFSFLVGESSIVVGGSDGSVNIFFLLNRPDAAAQDSLTLVKTRTFAPQPAAIVGFSPSEQSKTFATLDASGGIRVRHATSERTLVSVRESGMPRSDLAGMIVLAPRVDGLLALGNPITADFWGLSIPHPETSLRTLFGKVWYEGYPEPTYTWQSTGATEAFEPKISLVPLIFGTLKATFYSLLFAIPVALLAAIYTSEFLDPDLRGKIKPAIEVMASIPSVVLGFVAALVLAPVVETWIAAVLLVFVVVPMSLVLAAYLWQLVPPPIALRMEGIPKFLFMLSVVCLAMFTAYHVGPVFEDLFFDGNFKAWLNRDRGAAAPFWFLALLPVSAVAVSTGLSRLFGQRFNRYIRTLQPFPAALADLGRWLAVAGGTLAASYIMALVLQGIGIDPRSSVVGTYVQRNTLVVGFAMGFAVIPIIYTLADDALNSVPDHLRSASLGCGATIWQTTIWVILPTAISGVFSAVMIGMGRAVGETMILVMSAGNTPLLDLNIFNGLRALSANIAVELPEAPKDDTLYRVLFLTGLVLFAMTFVINTIAEMVRLHFRKRSMQL